MLFKRCQLKQRSLICLLLLLPTLVSARPHLHKEKFYADRWCFSHQGEREVLLPDYSRVDCVTRDYVIEVEFARKWAEAVGQVLYYGAKSGRKKGIVLILERAKDKKYLRRLKTALRRNHVYIKIWTIHEYL